MKLTPFTKHDYDGYAGAEGPNPKIREIDDPQDETTGYVVVVDTNGIYVDYVTICMDDDTESWGLNLPNQAACEILAETFTFENIRETMTKLGFQKF